MKKKAAFALVAAGTLTLGLLAQGGSAVASRLINSHDIKNNSVKSIDIKDNTLKSRDIKDGTITSADLAPGTVKQGPMGPAGQPGAPFTYVGENWSLIDRNSIGNFVGALRAGPSSVGVEPPLGIGSLGLQTGSGSDKVAFGNQIDWTGDPLSSINTVKYGVFTTGENIAAAPGAVNLPGVTFEIDPTGSADSTGPNYSSLVYVPVAAPANTWSTQDASTADQWFLTGAAGSGSCNQGPEGYCTLDEVKAKFPNATILSVAFGKGRDYAFTGAVDALQINDTTFDFEPNGVRKVNN